MGDERHEIQQRVFIGDLLDEREELWELKFTLDEIVTPDGHAEQQNEDFELRGEYVTYNELTDQFGTAKIDAFIEDAIQQAR